MNYAFEICANLIEGILVTQFFVRYFGFKNRTNQIIKILLMTVLYAVCMSVINADDYIGTISGCIIDAAEFILAVVLLKGKVLEKLLLVQMRSVEATTVSVLLTGAFKEWISYDSNGYARFGMSRIVLVIAAQLIFVLFAELIIRTKIKDEAYVTNGTYISLNIVMTATVLAEIFMLNIVYRLAVADEIITDIYAAIVGLVAIDIVVYVLYIRLTNSSIQLISEKMKNAAYENEKLEIKSVNDKYEQTAKIRHDIKNMLAPVLLRLDEGNIEAAKQSIRKIVDIDLKSDKIFDTGNRLADAMIYKYKKYCDEHNVSLTIKIRGTLAGIEEVDIAIVLSNMLDNAIAAAEKCSNPEVRLQIEPIADNVHICVINTCADVPVIRNGLPVTTKDDKKLHGYGLSNVKEITEKYDGRFKFHCSDNACRVDTYFNVHK